MWYLQTQVVHLISGWVFGIRISGPPVYGAGPWIWGHWERSTCPGPSSDPPMGPGRDLLKHTRRKHSKQKINDLTSIKVKIIEQVIWNKEVVLIYKCVHFDTGFYLKIYVYIS